MNYEEEQKKKQERFIKLQQEIAFLNNEIANRQQELYRLQGEFRLLEQLKANNKNNHGTTETNKGS